jgi:adenylate cyclase
MSVAQAMTFDAWLRLCRHEPEVCHAQAEEIVAYCTQHELPFWMPNGLQIRGWARIELGDVDGGMADWERGIELWNMVRGSLGRTAYDAMFALAKARTGKLAEARAVIERCKQLVAASGERYSESEVRRVDAELLLLEAGGVAKASDDARAEASGQLLYAVDRARTQGARTLELRALTALAELEAARGGAAQATRNQLAGLVATFTEGLDTADLKRARAALA